MGGKAPQTPKHIAKNVERVDNFLLNFCFKMMILNGIYFLKNIYII
jgi:hypothetical protein